MAICTRCQQDISIWNGGIDRITKLCKDCMRITDSERQAARAAREAMLQSIAQGNLSVVESTIHLESDELCHLEWPVTYQNVPGRIVATNKKLYFLASAGTGSFTVKWNSVLSVTYGPDSFHLELSQQSGSGFYFVNDPQYIAFVLDAITRLSKIAAREAMLQSIAQGNLPTVKSTIHLESDELCHLELPVTYQKQLKSGPQNVPGRIVATNKKLYFLASTGTGSFTVKWNSVLLVTYAPNSPRSFHLELSRQSGSGSYFADDPQYIALVLDTITRINKREVMPTQTRSGNRTAIPQEVKSAVWQRDQGRCVQCGSNQNIEYDHIIPLSLGGAHSVNNIQLLCRSCNSKKSNHI